MKKLVALFAGLIIFGISAISVSAESYEVNNGDTLWDIAIKYNTTIENIMELNGLKSSLIYPKQEIIVEENEIEYYIVEKGDTLSEISRSTHGDATVAELKEWNDLSSDLIVVGQELIVNEADAKASNKTYPVAVQESSVKEKKQEQVQTASSKSESEETEEQGNLEVKSKKKEKITEAEPENPEGRTLTVEATAYTAFCSGCSGITATGVNLKANPHAKVISVDPTIIPLGTEVYVEGYGHAVAADTGGAIKGNRIDVHLPTKNDAYNWGRRTVEITILE